MVRIEMEVSADTFAELEKLKEEAGFTTQKDLFNHALSMFEEVVKEVRNGRRIASVDTVKSTCKELDMGFLEKIKGKG